MFSLLKNYYTDAFFKSPDCSICACEVKKSNMLCGICWARLKFITEPLCQQCGLYLEYAQENVSICQLCHEQSAAVQIKSLKSNTNNKIYQLPKVRSALIYNNFLANAIVNFKHSNNTTCIPIFAKMMFNAAIDLLQHADFIIPVPIHHFRYITRGFNQSMVLAKHFSKISNSYGFNVRYIPDLLIKIANSESQKGKARLARQQNVKNSFIINKQHLTKIIDKNIIIIDDVYTTGATVNECAKVLYKSKINNVSTITLARSIIS